MDKMLKNVLITLDWDKIYVLLKFDESGYDTDAKDMLGYLPWCPWVYEFIHFV